MKDASADIFVGVHDLVDIRREVLRSSQETLKILQSYEQYKRLRTQKLQQVLKLYRVLSEIAALNKKLKSILPKISVQEQGPLAQSITVDETEQVVLKPAKSKLDLLEEELEVIESRLSALG